MLDGTENYIVGFTGKIGVGKTTLAKMVCANLNAAGYMAKCGSFGDPMRFSLCAMFEFSVEDIFSSEKKWPLNDFPSFTKKVQKNLKKHPLTKEIDGETSLRTLLQTWGEGMRRTDPLVWENCVKEWIEMGPPQVYLLDDVRRISEVNMCNVLYRVMPYAKYREDPGANHVAEHHLDNYGFEDAIVIDPEQYGLDFLKRCADQISTQLLRNFRLGEYMKIVFKEETGE